MTRCILGIDPGLENTGWGVIKQKESGDFELVDCGVIKTKSITESSERLRTIYEAIEGLLKRFDIERVGLERLFFAKNAKSAIKVSEAIGVIKVCAANNHKIVKEFTPLAIKMALVGYGRAEKEQVEIMVRTLLGLEEIIKVNHASDAVAVALTAGNEM